MNDLPRQKLKEIIIQYGRSLCDEPQRCEGLLRDLCGQYQKEIAVLVGALKERVPADLLASQNSTPPVVFLARLMGLRQKTNREKPQLQSPLGIYFEKPKIAETQIYQGKIINRG
jgi:hypothetical protein